MIQSKLDHLLLDYKTQITEVNVEDKLDCIKDNDYFLSQNWLPVEVGSTKSSNNKSVKNLHNWNSLVNMSDSISDLNKRQ